MDSNPYREFRETPTFETTKQLIDSLPDYINEQYPNVYEEWEGTTAIAIADDVTWEDMERSGTVKNSPITHVEYTLERDGLRLWLTIDLQQTDHHVKEGRLKVTLGNDINDPLAHEQQETIKLIVRNGTIRST